MRVKLSKNNREKLFLLLQEKYGNSTNVAKKIGAHRRTLVDWQKGISTIPLQVFNRFIKILDIPGTVFHPKIISDYWYTKEAAIKGGLATTKLHGNCGTIEGRRKGGLTSIATHKKNGTLFNTLKDIQVPKKSEKLAEFFGIIFGDGHLSEYQVSISTNSMTDSEHALFAQKLIKELFGVEASFKIKKNENVINVVASSKKLVRFLNKNGMPIGNKIENNLAVPSWVKRKDLYKKAFLRGLFDTDGCVYLDVHKIKNKIYKHLGLTITSYADNLILDVINLLESFGFTPTNQVTQKSVYLRRQKEIVRYFREIKTSNPKHYNRYIKFIGEVPKWP